MGGAGRRVALLRALFLAMFLVLAARAAHLSVVTTRGEIRAKGQLEGVMVLAATRGLIVDRNGVELALSVHTPSIYVRPGDFDGNPKNLRALAKALGQRPSALAERLRKRKHFTFVARWVGDAVAKRVEALELPGVGIVSEPRRAYPADELAGSILGFANIDGKGVRGVEEQEDEWLRGTPVRSPVERDARGRLLARASVAPLSSSGGDVALTIDMAMQAEAETALRNAIEKSGARGGCVVTIDPQTGEILALAEAPGFNPNDFRQIKYHETRSPAFQDAIEPGSVFKAFLIAGALEAGAIGPKQVIDTGDGTLAIKGKTIRDHRPYGVIDPTGVLKFSSNVGAVMIAEWLGREAHYETLKRFGFGSRTGSGFPSESHGLMRPWQDWKAIDHATVAFGQGLGVTAIQLTAAMGVLASDGQLRVPRLVSARRAAGGEWQSVTPDPPSRVVTRKSAARVLKMMESVVTAEGTGRKAALSGVRVAGKTGTAQKLDTARGTYSKDRYTAWFMGAAPADHPKLVIVAMLDEPKGPAHGGGDVAAPLFAKVAAGQLTRLGIVTRPDPIPAPPRVEMLTKTKKPKTAVKKTVQRVVSTHTPKTQNPAIAKSKKSTPTRSVSNATARVVSSAGSTPLSNPTTPTTSTIAQTAAIQLPAVSAGPTNTATRSSTRSSKDEPILMPDFRGETLDAVRQIADRNRLTLEVRGTGLAIDQQPTPGTVVVGAKKHVLVSFSDGGREG